MQTRHVVDVLQSREEPQGKRPADRVGKRLFEHDVRAPGLVKKGVVTRVSRGLYMLTDGEISESHPLAEVCKRVPKGIVCLLSALRFHGLTTQQPHEVWLALDGKARQPRVDHLALQIVRSSGEALRAGQKEHLIEGVSVKIYCPALEALRETWKEKRCTMDELMRYARICRVANVIRPYLESLS